MLDIRYSMLDDILIPLYIQIIEYPVSSIEHHSASGQNLFINPKRIEGK